MRRPVKPFVTEYRGGSRRSGQGSGPGLDLFKAEPVPGAPTSSPSTSSPPLSSLSSSPSSSSPWGAAQGEPQEDGYEAALRAADALFSGARSTAVAAQPALAAGEAPKSGAPTTGRVLRVLDEPPSPEMLEMERLEAEHAPKRRGRKPGSKNKPKVAALVPEPTAVPTTMPTSEARIVAAAPIAAAPLPAAVAIAVQAIATARARSPDEPRNGERYAWVRTRLKPGQQWKRRLPKVAW